MSSTVSDHELAARLNRLSVKVGKRATLTKPPPEPSPRDTHRSDSSSDEQLAGGALLGQEPVTRHAKTPRPILGAVDRQDPFDDSDFHTGETVDESFEFCPWQIIKTYHQNFVGKKNGPMVSPQLPRSVLARAAVDAHAQVKPFFDNVYEEQIWDL